QNAENTSEVERGVKWASERYQFWELLKGEPSTETIAAAREMILQFIARGANSGNVPSGDLHLFVESVGKWLLHYEMIDSAVEFSDWADPMLQQSNQSLSDKEMNDLCWRGALAGKASLVVKYGRRAVEHDPKNVDFKDTLA